MDWINEYKLAGNVRPKTATGNLKSAQEVEGVDLSNFFLHQAAKPKAYLDKLCAYVQTGKTRNPLFWLLAAFNPTANTL